MLTKNTRTRKRRAARSLIQYVGFGNKLDGCPNWRRRCAATYGLSVKLETPSRATGRATDVRYHAYDKRSPQCADTAHVLSLTEENQPRKNAICTPTPKPPVGFRNVSRRGGM